MLNVISPQGGAANDDTGRKTWTWMLLDSAIIGGIGLFTELISGPPSIEGLYKAVVSFGLAFFIQLAIERGLKRPSTPDDQ